MKRIWMGPRGAERWVPAPASGMTRSRVGYTAQQQYVNGGAGVVRSRAAHGEWEMAWANKSPQDMADIVAMAAGLYDLTPNAPIYFVDPSAASSNLMPEDWSAPGAPDVMPLVLGQRPEVSIVGAHGSYPRRAATIRPSAGKPRKVYLPIPTGHTLHLGAIGQESNAALTYGRVNANGETGSLSNLFCQNTPQPSPFTLAIDGTDSVRGVEISVLGAGSLLLRAMMARLVPTGSAKPSTDFVIGRGNAGASFVQRPTESLLSAALNGGEGYSSWSARLVEDEPWR